MEPQDWLGDGNIAANLVVGRIRGELLPQVEVFLLAEGPAGE
jgi:hypothetical protein